MPLRFALFLLALSAQAAVAPSPTTLAFTMRQGYAFPWNGTKYPADQTITLTGTGAWSAALSGTLSTGCGGPCFSISPTSGSGAGTITVSFTGLGSESLSVGAPTGTITITGGTANPVVTLTVVAHNPYDQVSSFSGPSGCSNSDAGYQSGPSFATFPDTCTITNERPTSTSFSIPSPGGSYTDPQHGGTVTRCTPSGYNIQYSVTTAFSASNTYVMVSDIPGNVYAWSCSTGAVVFGPLASVNINFAWWDPSDDNRLWYITGGQFKSVQVDTGVVTTRADFTSSSGGRPAITDADIGGTEEPTDDNWLAFFSQSNSIICGLNLNSITTGNQESHIFCDSYQGHGVTVTDADFPLISQVDSVSNKRYVLCMCLSQNLVWRVGASSLTFEYLIPTQSGYGISGAPHAALGQDAAGQQVIFFDWDDIYGNKTYLAAAALNAGTNLVVPVEAGGGLRLIFPDQPLADTGAHFGATWRGLFVYTPYGNSSGITPYFTVTSIVDNGATCTINLTGGTSPVSTTSVQIGGATGVTAINGVWTWTNTSGTAGTIPTGCAGSYTASSGAMAINTSSSSNGPLRQEIMLVKPGSPAGAGYVHRLAIHRSKIYLDGVSGYFFTPRASISRDGTRIAYASNMGVPGNPSVYMVMTGVNSATSRISGAVRISGNTVIH